MVKIRSTSDNGENSGQNLPYPKSRIFMGDTTLLSLVILMHYIDTYTFVGVFEYSTPETPQNQPYFYLPADRFPTNGNHLIFSAKARNDVHVTLTPIGGDGYEIVIGGWSNTKSAIRQCHQCTPQVELLHR